MTLAEQRQTALLARSLHLDPTGQPELYCVAARRAAQQLPERVHHALHSFGRWGSDTGTLLIEGIPLGRIPATPEDNKQHVGEATLLARVQAMFGESLGHLIAYEAEGSGRLFQDMVPARAAARTQTSLSSLTELELHTEQAFSALKPDYISLACLRGDPDARTYTLTAKQVSAHISGADLAVLRERLWMTGVDESFRVGGQQFDDGDVRGPMPIISGAAGDPYIVFDQDLMAGRTPEADAAFERVLRIYRTHRNHHVLKPGDILLVDNNRAVHGRSPFHPRFDGGDRFVVRSFVTNDLAKSRYARLDNGRAVGSRYS
ncbi:TauD/TfdA family dioxygenase [Kribbella yunnanensis]|uniref:TauD/TfdA family dioxygenase n=1 Tax=Kribbella yunnanensis TaxID=190194 RepID=UPI0031D3D6FE